MAVFGQNAEAGRQPLDGRRSAVAEQNWRAGDKTAERMGLRFPAGIVDAPLSLAQFDGCMRYGFNDGAADRVVENFGILVVPEPE